MIHTAHFRTPQVRLGLGAVALASLCAVASPDAQAAPVPGPRAAVPALTADAPAGAFNVQYYRGRPGYGRPYGGPPRAYGYGPGPRWGYRPWYRRPYYGTIIGGIALGTIVGVTAYGLAPRPPRPDLCWYWADEFQSRGYWDYC